MFDIGLQEMLVIVVVLIVVVGPKDLPKVLRMAGRWVNKARQMASEFQNSLQDMAREAELDDVQREIKKIGDTDVKTILKDTVDPTGDMAKDMTVELPDLNPDRALKSYGAVPPDEGTEAKPEIQSDSEARKSSEESPAPAADSEEKRES